ncbi:MAG: formamidopyrimidine-DNA glycosylase [Anaerolineae bacterium]|nr:formamidopyrimidine-DNA glycosylase [Anaerolineae bacterium]
MPEYPDVVVYIERLRAYVQGQRLEQIRIAHPFLLRTAVPPVSALESRTVTGFERIGKRIVFVFGDGLSGAGAAGGTPSDDSTLYLVVHLMVSGRLWWRKKGISIQAKRNLAALDFETGSLLMTEASTKKRASLHVVQGREALAEFHRGGLEVMDATLAAFKAALTEENHTLKRALRDPTILSGIGNAYSDEILHRARLSPFLLTGNLNDDQVARLYVATQEILTEWTARLRTEVGDGFPEKVTAFHEAMAVHGRYGQPCPVCGTPVQRIRYADNETNYCPTCQTEGRLLADRALSRLLKSDWPRTVEELENRRRRS